MGDRKLTLFELHIDGEPRIGPQTLSGFGNADEQEDEEIETAETEAEDDGTIGPVAVLIGLVALVAVAYGVKRWRTEDDEAPLEQSTTPDVVVD